MGRKSLVKMFETMTKRIRLLLLLKNGGTDESERTEADFKFQLVSKPNVNPSITNFFLTSDLLRRRPTPDF